MTRLFHRRIVTYTLFLSLILLFPWSARAQGHPAIQNHPTKDNRLEEITDKQISAFVKAYVAERKIRRTSESAIKKAQNEEEAKKIQQEADAEIAAALEKHGLDSQAYNRIFWAVRSNKELRAKVLELVKKEEQNG